MRGAVWVGLFVLVGACGNDTHGDDEQPRAGGPAAGRGGSAGVGTGGSAGSTSTGGGGNGNRAGRGGSGAVQGGEGDGAGAPEAGGEAGSAGPKAGHGGKGGSAAAAGEDDGGNGGEGPRAECVTAEDCAPPETTPPGCAEAACTNHVCVFSARDADGDGFAAKHCAAADGNVIITLGNDCDDGDDAVNPNGWDGPAGDGHPEGCNDGLDQDCSGIIDDDVLANAATCTCAPGDVEPCGTTSNGIPIDYPVLSGAGVPVGECHFGSRTCDTNGEWGPCVGAQGPVPETCDGLNNDCDTQTDEDALDFARFYCDADSDGHLASTSYELACAPAGNCAGTWREFPNTAPPSAFDDCDDHDSNNYPGKVEVCDGEDNDCNGVVDGASATNDLKTTFYRDVDGDGFGTTSSARLECTSPGAGWVLTGGDCNDGAGAVNPNGTESCNGTDDDCDGLTDAQDGSLTGKPTAPGTTFACTGGAWHVTGCPADQLDCDDVVTNACETSATSLSDCHGCDNTCYLACGSSACEELTELSAGWFHTCGITSTGRAACWGLNTDGRLGDGGNSQRTAPHPVSTLTSVTAVAAGGQHTCAIASPSSTLYCWGSDATGQLGNGAGSSANVATPGTVNGIGTATLTGVTSVATGTNHTCAVYGSGKVACWGQGTNGKLASGDTAQVNAPSQIYRTGDVLVADGSRVVLGKEHSCLLRTGGSVECWGDNSARQLGDGSTDANATEARPVSGLSNVTAIAAGDYHTCALTGGQVYCWGSNVQKQLGKASGTMYNTPQLVTGLSGVSALALGGDFSCARTGSTAACWGSNSDGQRGDADATSSDARTTLSLGSLTRLVAGTRHACALSSGRGYCWGYDSNGQLGNGTTGTAHTPTPQPISPLN